VTGMVPVSEDDEMFKVIAKGQEFKADEEVAMKEWMKGAKVFNAEGREAVGIEDTKAGERFMF
jgi:hypothetical protein